MTERVTAREALRRLADGNRRFVACRQQQAGTITARERTLLADGQQPFAVVLGCSDSRVPVELVFDQGLGDLFVIRVAGNIVAPSLIGSVEFSTEQHGTRLVVVLGHSRCGAVQATLAQLRKPEPQRSRNLAAIVDRIRPSVEHLVDRGDDAAMGDAVRANVRATVQALRAGSELIAGLIRDDGLLVVGAVYSLETGEVEFLDPPR